ncbi:hypothetical protein VTK73DRAFT_4494 [Phialemonium thermophilum]|uniref:Uncharacterized protein n=1 Tax=Phialemonium thermophilum TaxID=223376 RepID=A0ABR3V870_9PEZI
MARGMAAVAKRRGEETEARRMLLLLLLLLLLSPLTRLQRLLLWKAVVNQLRRVPRRRSRNHMDRNEQEGGSGKGRNDHREEEGRGQEINGRFRRECKVGSRLRMT